VEIKRQVAVTVLIGAGFGLCGCQSASLGGLAFWNRNGSSAVASATPDVGKQKFDGLSQQFAGNQPRPAGSTNGGRAGTVPLGGQRPVANDNFILASWKKATAAVSGVFAGRPQGESAEDDPLRLDNTPKKVGPEVYVAAARLLENQQRFAEAEEQYKKAIQAAPADMQAMVGLARLHDRQGRALQALELYQKAVQAHPQNALVYNDLGLSYARQRQIDKSLEALNKAVALQPDNGKYRNNLATILVEAGRIDEALRQLTVTNSQAVAHYNVGFLLQQKGQTQEAMRHLQQAAALDPSLEPAQAMLAQAAGSRASGSLATQAAPPAASHSIYEPLSVPKAGSNNQPSHIEALPAQWPATRRAPSSYHIGDDNGAIATAPADTRWDGAWPLQGQDRFDITQPLPPAQ
jgi:tetratricopeptide (TPR) repeat protein